MFTYSKIKIKLTLLKKKKNVVFSESCLVVP